MSFRSYDLFKLAEDFGQTLTLRKASTQGTYDTATGTLSGSATTDYSVTGYFFNYDTGLLDANDIRRSRRRCLIPALGLTVEPDDEDQIIGNGDTVSIIQVTTMFSGATKIGYICEVSE